MKSLPLLAGAIYLQPWFILPDTHGEISRQFRDHLAASDPVGPVAKTRDGTPVFLHPQVEAMDGLAYLAVEGIIGRKLSALEMSCGGFDLTNFERQMANVRDDPAVRVLILDFDTPGGMAAGVESAALAIREVADSGKKVIAYTDGMCCSAGYFLAAACDEILAQADSQVGSISTICVGVDSSRQWEMQGLELKVVATGALKALGQRGKRWTDEEMKFLADRAAVVDSIFKGFVSQRRPALAAESMNGGFWYARAAPAGMIDGIAKSVSHVIEAALLTLG